MGQIYLNRCRSCQGTGFCEHCKQRRKELADQNSRKQAAKRFDRPILEGLLADLLIVPCDSCNGTGRCILCGGCGGFNLADT